MSTAKKIATKKAAKKSPSLVKQVLITADTAKEKTIKKVAEANLSVVKQSKEEIAAKKKADIETNEVLYRTTQVLVPLWFGTKTVKNAFSGPQLTGEAAICLMFVGANSEKGQCQVGVEMNLRPGFDREEAQLLARVGFHFLRENKLVKSLKAYADKEIQLQNVILTAKGQKIYDCAKRSMLVPFDKAKSYI